MLNFSGKFKELLFQKRCCRIACGIQKDGVSNVFENAFSSFRPEFFPKNLGAVNNEHGELFYRDFHAMEESSEGVCHEGLMCDFCWMLHHDVLPTHTNGNRGPNFLKSSILKLALIAVLSGSQVESNHFIELFLNRLS